MKVVCLNVSYPSDSGRRNPAAQVELIAHGLVARGHDVTVVAAHDMAAPTAASGDEFIDGVRVIRLGFPEPDAPAAHGTASLWRRHVRESLDGHTPDGRNFALTTELRRVLRRLAPDAIFAHDLGSLPATAWLACAGLDLPVAQVLHDYAPLCPRGAMFHDGHACVSRCPECIEARQLAQQLSNRVDAVIGVSRAVLRAHLNAGLFAQARYQAVIENAIALPPAPVPPLHRPQLEFGYLGTLAPAGGVDELCAAFAQLRAQYGDAIRLSIGHHGDAADAARTAWLAEHHAGSGIDFVGPADSYDFFAGLDVSIAPTRWNDPWPHAAIESIGFGVPVIGARRGALDEVIVPGINGLLFEPDQPGALAAAMRGVIEQPAAMHAMHRRCRRSIERLLDVERMVDEHEEVIHALTLARRPRAPSMARAG